MKKNNDKKLIKNKIKKESYQIIEKFTAGIILEGSEVKSIKLGQATLKNSYGKISNKEIFLHNLQINCYKHSSFFVKRNYQSNKTRKLLLKKEEIKKISFRSRTKKLIIVPLQILIIKGLIKVEIALVKPLKKYQTKAKIKEKELKKKMKNMW